MFTAAGCRRCWKLPLRRCSMRGPCAPTHLSSSSHSTRQTQPRASPARRLAGAGNAPSCSSSRRFYRAPGDILMYPRTTAGAHWPRRAALRAPAMTRHRPPRRQVTSSECRTHRHRPPARRHPRNLTANPRPPSQRGDHGAIQFRPTRACSTPATPDTHPPKTYLGRGEGPGVRPPAVRGGHRGAEPQAVGRAS